MSIPRVLSIAGTDPSGGAGIHADIKSITAAGGYAMGAVTALVSQNTAGVSSIYYPDASVLADQLKAVSDDVVIDAVKIGMLGRSDYIEVVSSWLDKVQPPVVVVDPVMVATSGDRLISDGAEEQLRKLLSRATLITPNIPELEILARLEPGSIRQDAQAQDAAQAVARTYNTLVAVKGGHLQGKSIINHLIDSQGIVAISSGPRIETSSTHGTGCSQSSALATRLAAGDTLAQALSWVTRWLTDSIRAAHKLQVGTGHGPIDHSHRMRTLASESSAVPWLSQTIDSAKWAQGIASNDDLGYAVPPVGRWTRLLGDISREILEATLEDAFLTDLRSGALDPWAFTAYQRQDEHYLNRYAKALSLLAARASNPSHSAFWSGSSAGAIGVEQELHRVWLSQATDAGLEDAAILPPSPVTLGYTNHLLAQVATDDYVVGACAVLPCFWMYAEIGLRLAEANSPEHPYHLWLSTYGDDSFTETTGQALRLTEDLLEHTCSEEQRERAIRAYLEACLWERKFFAQAEYLTHD